MQALLSISRYNEIYADQQISGSIAFWPLEETVCGNDDSDVDAILMPGYDDNVVSRPGDNIQIRYKIYDVSDTELIGEGTEDVTAGLSYCPLFNGFFLLNVCSGDTRIGIMEGEELSLLMGLCFSQMPNEISEMSSLAQRRLAMVIFIDQVAVGNREYYDYLDLNSRMREVHELLKSEDFIPGLDGPPIVDMEEVFPLVLDEPWTHIERILEIYEATSLKGAAQQKAAGPSWLNLLHIISKLLLPKYFGGY